MTMDMSSWIRSLRVDEELKIWKEIMSLIDISPKEEAVIEELKRRTMDCITPKMLEDNYLFYRFAKARDFKLNQAEFMLREHICWRKEMGVDTILTDYKPPEVLVKYISGTIFCLDKEGCLVVYADVGRFDCKGLWNCVSKQETLRHLLYILEREKVELLKQKKKFGKNIFVGIFDFEDLSYGTATHMTTLQNGLYLLKSYVDNFPETLKCALVINAPFYFLWAFAVLKQVLPPIVIQKTRIYGTDGWREELLKLIDADVLPAFLGGNKTDPDGNPLCKTFIKRGEPIPKSYYKSNGKKNLDTDLQKLTILPCCKKEISFEVKEANSNLEWKYYIRSKEIDFSLQFKGETTEPVEFIPKYRVESCYETEKGLFKCEKVGTYTIVLDNSYSWIHPKEVYFRAEVISPKNVRSEPCL